MKGENRTRMTIADPDVDSSDGDLGSKKQRRTTAPTLVPWSHGARAASVAFCAAGKAFCAAGVAFCAAGVAVRCPDRNPLLTISRIDCD